MTREEDHPLSFRTPLHFTLPSSFPFITTATTTSFSFLISVALLLKLPKVLAPYHIVMVTVTVMVTCVMDGKGGKFLLFIHQFTNILFLPSFYFLDTGFGLQYIIPW